MTFLAVYESKLLHFGDGDVVVSRSPCPQEPYEAYLEGCEESGITGFGDTILSAIADLNRKLLENES
jgi:hypothetical protein